MDRRYAGPKEKGPLLFAACPVPLVGIYEPGDRPRIDDRYTSRSYLTGALRETDLRT